MKKRLIIVDVSNFIFRAFFAIRVLNAPDGTPVNAVHGVLGMLLKLISKYRPTHILVAKDSAGPSFRNKIYPEYKANRSEPPEDLIPQFGLIKELVEKMQLPYCQDGEFEADDIIGSACVQWKDEFDEILIASGDKDLMQFVGGNVKMIDTMKDKIYDEKGVVEKMGVRPDQIIDYLSIVGDTSDNIPGMKGVGAKGAAQLLSEYGTLENCIKNKENFKGKRLINAFENYLEDAKLSKELVKIVTKVDLCMSPDQAKYSFYPSDELVNFLKNLGFKTVLKRLEEMRYQDHVASQNGQEEVIRDFPKESVKDDLDVILVKNDNYKKALEDIDSCSAISMSVVYNSEDIIQRKVVSVAVGVNQNKSYYFPFIVSDSKDVLGLSQLKQLFEKTWGREEIEICSENPKADFIFSLVNNYHYKAQHFDIVQAHYNISSSGRHELESAAVEYLDYHVMELDKKVKIFAELDIQTAQAYLGEKAIIMMRLAEIYKEELKKLELEKIYYEIDDLLVDVLAKMEKEGITLNRPYFKELEKELEKKLANIEHEISKHTKGPVNLNSPKQVATLLFEELNLPTARKTKTGFSTDSEVLEELDAKGLSEVPGLILQYREFGKLLSTYVKALPSLVNEKSGRVHTSFNQHVARTGRLSSTNPNLQNIPIRSEEGRKVRKGFIASPGKILLGADYSQVELRLLAHFSGDETMIQAFNNGEDIHAQTASEILGIALKEITQNERSKAKAVNFGLMYGQSSFGLARVLKIPRRDAKEYIDRYFSRFSKVKAYLDSLKEKCEETGYAITMHGRKRLLPDIHSNNRNIKAEAERMAINSPIQGTAADIIKLAMIKIDREMREKKLKSKMLLQVHDELIFEVEENELEKMKKLVREGMENIVSLKVPLKVDVGVGVNWFDLK